MNIDEEVRIRTKTINGFNLEENPYLKNRIIEVITNFRETNFSNAFRTLFLMIYGFNEENLDNRIEILHKFNFTCVQDDLPFYTYLTKEQITLLGNELRHQYCKEHPDFLAIKENCAYSEELTELKTAMHKHPLLLFKAVENCEKHSTEEYVSSCVEQLLSDTPHSQFYGLRGLGHNRHYAELLLPYAKQIGNLLLAMYYTKQQENTPVQKAFDEKKYSDDEFCKRLIHLYNHGVDLNLLAKNMSENNTQNIYDSLQVVLQEIDSFDEKVIAFDEVLDTLYNTVDNLRVTFTESLKYFVRA